MHPTTPTSTLRKRQDARGYRILAGSVLTVAAIGVTLIYNQPPVRDPVTGCPQATAAPLQTVLVLDRTDPWSPAEAAIITSALAGLTATIRPGDRLTLYAFEGNGTTPPVPVFDRCRPVEGKDVNPAFVTPAKADKAFATLFADPLAKTVDLLTRSSHAPQTNLVPFLSTLAATLTYQPKAAETRITIFSDMCENTTERTFLPGKKPQFDPVSFTQYVHDATGNRLAHLTLDIAVMPSPTTPPPVARKIKAAWTAALTADGVAFTWRTL